MQHTLLQWELASKGPAGGWEKFGPWVNYKLSGPGAIFGKTCHDLYVIYVHVVFCLFVVRMLVRFVPPSHEDMKR